MSELRRCSANPNGTEHDPVVYDWDTTEPILVMPGMMTPSPSEFGIAADERPDFRATWCKHCRCLVWIDKTQMRLKVKR